MPEHARSFTQLQDHNGLLWASECNSLRERRFTSAHESVKGKPACYKVVHLALRLFRKSFRSCLLRLWP
jgi:hypothetical protein